MDRRQFLGLAPVSAFTVGSRPRSSPQTNRWQPDGVGSLARIGVLTPDFDPVPESEMRAMAPAGISIHGARISAPRGNPRAFAESPAVDVATGQLAALTPRVIVYGYTSSSYALGLDGDGALKNRLMKRAGGTPVVLPCEAATEALRLLGAQRIALINPPWFSEATSDLGRTYFQAAGFTPLVCARIAPFAPFHEVAPLTVYEWVREHVPREAQAVVIGGNGLRAVGVIQALEETLRRPVLTANQVAFWKALRLAGVRDPITRYGAVFTRAREIRG
jgi:maleate isomerase